MMTEVLLHHSTVNVSTDGPGLTPEMATAIPAPHPQTVVTKLRNGHLNLGNFSPVNQNGSFEFDKVLKSGTIHKRTRKTKQWRTFYLVLRPNLLSIYKSSSEEKLLKQISLSDLTAVAYVRDPKGKRKHLFGLYSPARNYHLQARSEEEARDWVRCIMREARIDEEEEEVLYRTPTRNQPHVDSVNFPPPVGDSNTMLGSERYTSSSPEPIDSSGDRLPKTATMRGGIKSPSGRQASGMDFGYSGNEMGSYSEDPSDGTPGNSFRPTTSFGSFLEKTSPKVPRSESSAGFPHPKAANTASPSQVGGLPQTPITDELDRVIHHGHLLCLKSRRGVKQWKRLWVVLRSRSLTFYKSEDEYAALKIIPLSSLISAVEIDALSRSKNCCMQIIAEEKNYRFCAPDEASLARWLGAVKSRLVKRKEREWSTDVPVPTG